MTFINQCKYTVWPALVGNVYLSTTGFVLPSGQNSTLTVPVKWEGIILGRTLCTTDAITGNFSCVTADCNSGNIACHRYPSPPNTLVKFRLDFNGLDSYAVTFEDGFNLPVIVVPTSGSGSNCVSTGCAVDLNAVCPTELKVTRNEQVVACRNPCSGNRSLCEPSVYYKIIKTACPQAYFTSLHDYQTMNFSCSNPADYNIVFCPTPARLDQLLRLSHQFSVVRC